MLVNSARTGIRHLRVARILVVVVLAGSILGASSRLASSTSWQSDFEPYVETTCPFPDQVISALGTTLTCAVLSAPMVHGIEDGATVDLSIARIQSVSESPAAAPLVMLLGGPGQEVESILSMFATDSVQSYRPLLERQDVILLDQRGVGYSEPSLACPFDAVGGVRVPVQSLDVDDPVPAFAECASTLRATWRQP